MTALLALIAVLTVALLLMLRREFRRLELARRRRRVLATHVRIQVNVAPFVAAMAEAVRAAADVQAQMNRVAEAMRNGGQS